MIDSYINKKITTSTGVIGTIIEKKGNDCYVVEFFLSDKEEVTKLLTREEIDNEEYDETHFDGYQFIPMETLETRQKRKAEHDAINARNKNRKNGIQGKEVHSNKKMVSAQELKRMASGEKRN